VSADRERYRILVTDVAARARAILPQETNGRIESAIKLVLLGEVQPQQDGSIQVGSCTDPTKVYHLVGLACDCADYPRAPELWCKHRIAAGIQKRVGELLAATHTPALASEPLYESPASVNVRLTIGGREVQLTLRDHDEARLLVRLEEVLQRYPAPAPQAPAPPIAATPQCPTHGALKKSAKGKGWYCPVKLDDGSWCPSKGT
jgi:hypothetical protein